MLPVSTGDTRLTGGAWESLTPHPESVASITGVRNQFVTNRRGRGYSNLCTLSRREPPRRGGVTLSIPDVKVLRWSRGDVQDDQAGATSPLCSPPPRSRPLVLPTEDDPPHPDLHDGRTIPPVLDSYTPAHPRGGSRDGVEGELAVPPLLHPHQDGAPLGTRVIFRGARRNGSSRRRHARR